MWLLLCLLSPLFINKEQNLTVLFIEDQINSTIRFAVVTLWPGGPSVDSLM